MANLKPEYTILDSWNIAELVHSRYEPHPNYTLGFDKLNSNQLTNIRSVFSKFLVSNLFSADQWLSITNLAGFSDEKPHKTALQDALASLRTLEKQQRAIGNQVVSRPPDAGREHHVNGPASVTYLNHSKNFIVTNGPEVKIFAKDSSTTATSFSNFSNFPQYPEDTVGLRLPVSDLTFLLDRVDWTSFESSQPVINFMRDIAQYYSGEFVVLPYISAMVGVTSVIEALQNLYLNFEQFGQSVNKKDVESRAPKVSKNPQIKKVTSFRQINKLLRVMLGLEDQLWAMTQSDAVSERVKRLWPAQTSRLHSAFGRVSSFLNFTDSESPLTLAELGLFNYADKEKKLAHFMEPSVPIEAIYEDQGSIPIEVALQKQFTENYMLKGLDTFNVPLASTVNNLPPSLHTNFMPAGHPSHGEINVVKSLPHSDMVMTGSLEHGSVNVWSTKLGMHLLSGYNYLDEYYRSLASDEPVAFKLKSLKENTEHNVTLFTRKGGNKPQPVAKPQTQEPELHSEGSSSDDAMDLFGLF